MDVTLHGTLQYFDKGRKKVKVIVSAGDPRDKQVLQLPDDLAVNQGSITAELKKQLPGLDRVKYRPRVRPIDLKREAVK